jgi:inhibitor of KinA
MDSLYPRIRFVGDAGILVEFGDHVERTIHEQVLKLDHLLTAKPFKGQTSSVPSYAALLVGYDPCEVEPKDIEARIRELLEVPCNSAPATQNHEIFVCYDDAVAADLSAVATQMGITTEEVIAAHLSTTYRVYMYGFAPGFAYLGGVPRSIQVPRRTEPVRGVPSGTVIIAGPQCIVTTLEMPSGWWRIGRSPNRILDPELEHPFLFNVGDGVQFVRVELDEFEALEHANKTS